MTTPETADHLLPVFAFAPDWSDGITERLEWLTHLLPSETQVEQAIQQRLAPRRSFEAAFAHEGAERSFLVSFLDRFGADEMMVPLWHDAARLTAAVTAGATSLTIDSSDYREFTDGGMALLVGPTALASEAVRIDTVTGSTITLLAATAADFPAGTRVHPMRRAEIAPSRELSRFTSSVARGSLRFRLTRPDDFTADVSSLPTYLGKPLIDVKPNWSGGLDMSVVHEVFELDSGPGRWLSENAATRGFETFRHNWLVEGREEHAWLRGLLYALRGRAGAVWLPSFNDDLLVASAAASGTSVLDVEACGLDYLNVPFAGREHLFIAGQARSIASLGAPPSSDVERINLGSVFTADVAAGARGNFLDVARLDMDGIDIRHETDSDGVATVTLTFRTIDDSRDGTGLSVVPIPEAEMNSTPCNAPPEGGLFLKWVMPTIFTPHPDFMPGGITANDPETPYSSYVYLQAYDPDDPTRFHDWLHIVGTDSSLRQWSYDATTGAEIAGPTTPGGDPDTGSISSVVDGNEVIVSLANGLTPRCTKPPENAIGIALNIWAVAEGDWDIADSSTAVVADPYLWQSGAWVEVAGEATQPANRQDSRDPDLVVLWAGVVDGAICP